MAEISKKTSPLQLTAHSGKGPLPQRIIFETGFDGTGSPVLVNRTRQPETAQRQVARDCLFVSVKRVRELVRAPAANAAFLGEADLLGQLAMHTIARVATAGLSPSPSENPPFNNLAPSSQVILIIGNARMRSRLPPDDLAARPTTRGPSRIAVNECLWHGTRHWQGKINRCENRLGCIGVYELCPNM